MRLVSHGILLTFFLIPLALESYAKEVEKDSCDGDICCQRARARAIEIRNEMAAFFPLEVSATAQKAAAGFTSFFAPGGVFQTPFGINRGKDAIFQTVLAYGQGNIPGVSGEINQAEILRKAYWDSKKSTLVVEATWHATVQVDTQFPGCTNIIPAGATYFQDDADVIRFECGECEDGCCLPDKVVYYHEYFNVCQTVSEFTDIYPPPCECAGEPCDCVSNLE